jgi:hypothetical protein
VLRPTYASHQARHSKDGATTVRIVPPSASASTIPEDSARVYLTGVAFALKNVTVMLEVREEIKPHQSVRLAAEKVMPCHCNQSTIVDHPAVTIPTTSRWRPDVDHHHKWGKIKSH